MAPPGEGGGPSPAAQPGHKAQSSKSWTGFLAQISTCHLAASWPRVSGPEPRGSEPLTNWSDPEGGGGAVLPWEAVESDRPGPAT